jgi:predicted NBD/HSP70 family sugar kinase
VQRVRIGVDLGGTKIEVLAMDGCGGELLRRRIATPQGDYAATVAAVAALVGDAERRLAARGSIGIAAPGAVSRVSGCIKNANSVCLNGRALSTDLERALQRPVRIANDADCLALSEAHDGAAAGAASVFGVIVGTGVGGGIVLAGKLLAGHNAISGEWGHNPLPWPLDDERPGAECYCGRSGCIETWLCGAALEQEYRRISASRLSAEQIAQRDQRAEPAAVQALDRYCDRMARALATVINVVDPECIVLGGGVGNIARLYRDVPRRWTRYVFSDRVDTRLLKPRFGDSSGVRGAARLWDA